MRIGEFEDAVGKELLARRSMMAAEVTRLGEKLAEPAGTSIRPAVALPDAVHISAEARGPALDVRSLQSTPVPLPSPAEVVSVLQQFDAAPAGNPPPELVARLADVIGRLARAFAGSGAALPGGQLHAAAAALVRQALAARGLPPSGASPAEADPLPDRVAALVRDLLAAAAPQRGDGGGLAVASRHERAAAALLIAAMGAFGPGSEPAESRASPALLPPSLLAFLAQPARAQRRRRRPASATEPEEDSGEQHDEQRAHPRWPPGGVSDRGRA